MWYHCPLTTLQFKRMINHLVLIVLISKSDQKIKTEMKTNTNCAPDESVTLANRFSEWNCNDLALALTTVGIIFGEQLHLFL